MAELNAGGDPVADSGPKPEEESTPQVFNIKVKDQQENEVFFKIKPTTKLGKVFKTYCERQSVDPRTVRFLLQGHRIQETDTPETLEMEDGDEIQAVIEQQGGESSPVLGASDAAGAPHAPHAPGSPGAPDAPEPKQDGPKNINIKVLDQAQNELFFRIRMSTPLRKVMNTYCERQGILRNSVRFLIEGERIRDDDTPASQEMEDGDTIEVFTQQLGGDGGAAEGGEGSAPANGDGQPKEEGVKKHITLNIKYNNANETAFKVKPTTRMEKVMDAYCKLLGREPNSLRFFAPDGKRIHKQDTPESLELEDNDLLDAHEEQQGGVTYQAGGRVGN